MTAKRHTTSLVIVDTDSYELAKVALGTTLQQFAADAVLVFSDKPEEWPGFDVVQIPSLTSMSDYNRTIIGLLPNHLRTDFALVIQYDGFAINGGAFTEAFYEADYVGAPWPVEWLPRRGAVTVGNGGFSLRSKRLVESVAAYSDRIDFDAAEDATICLYLREALETQDSVRFASVDLARRFSVEMERSQTVEPFGFHGLHLLPVVYADNYRFLLDNLPARCFQPGSSKLKSLRAGFAGLGNEANRLLEARVNA